MCRACFCGHNNKDKVGVIFFSDKIEFYIPPKKGRDHVLYIVRELLTMEPKGKGTNLNEAVRFFNNSTKQKSIAFILSDFLVENYDDALRVAGSKHDVIGIKVYDKMDMHLPRIGLVQVEDAETGIRHGSIQTIKLFSIIMRPSLMQRKKPAGSVSGVPVLTSFISARMKIL